jgi:osmotically-inducible protein OsmY
LVPGNLEAAMNNRDESIRAKLLDRLTAVDVDAGNLTIEVASGAVTVRGSVPSEEQRQRTIEALAGARSVAIYVRGVAAV